MRFYLIIFLCVCCLAPVIAQYCPPLSGKLGETKRFHITAGYGITQLYGDVHNNNAIGSSGTITVDYQIKKGLLIGVESQFGSLITEVINSDNPKQSHNDYMAGGFRVIMHPFSFFSKKSYLRSFKDVILESLYVGVGSLYIINHYDYIYHNPANYSTYGMVEGYDNSGLPIFKDRTRTLILPSMNLGAVLPLNNQLTSNGPALSLVINSQFNMGQNDVLDGYTPYSINGNPSKSANDFYNFYSLGLRYSF
jgi:hypothetical protein